MFRKLRTMFSKGSHSLLHNSHRVAPIVTVSHSHTHRVSFVDSSCHAPRLTVSRSQIRRVTLATLLRFLQIANHGFKETIKLLKTTHLVSLADSPCVASRLTLSSTGLVHVCHLDPLVQSWFMPQHVVQYYTISVETSYGRTRY